MRPLNRIRRIVLRCGVSAIALAAAGMVHGQVFKCVGANGKAEYSDVPCERAGMSQKDVKITASPESPVSTANNKVANSNKAADPRSAPIKGRPTPMVQAPVDVAKLKDQPPSKEVAEMAKSKRIAQENVEAERQRRVEDQRAQKRIQEEYSKSVQRVR